MRRVAILMYGVLAYAMFLAVLVYAGAFLCNVLYHGIDCPVTLPQQAALTIDGLLVILVIIQQWSVTRPSFRQWCRKRLPLAALRSTYVFTTSATLLAVLPLWQPLGGVVWCVDDLFLRTFSYCIFGAGAIMVLGATSMQVHFDRMGLRQIWSYCRGRRCDEIQSDEAAGRTFMLGMLMTVWAAPTMTPTHLVLAVLVTFALMFGRIIERMPKASKPEMRDEAEIRERLRYEECQRRVERVLGSTNWRAAAGTRTA